jgi:hypothetical protein
MVDYAFCLVSIISTDSNQISSSNISVMNMNKSYLITLIGPLSSQVYDSMSSKLSKPLAVKFDTQAAIRRAKSTYKVSNDMNISLMLETLVEDVRKALDSVNYPVLSNQIFLDAADATCVSILSRLLPIMKALSPYMAIHVVNLTFGSIFGLYSAHMVYSSWLCFEYADSFSIRDIPSSSYMISPPPITTEPGKSIEAEFSYGVSLDEMLRATALDMLVLDYTLSHPDLNIHVQTISRCKLFDIRSSYWKYLAAYKRQSARSSASLSSSAAAAVDYSPIRSLSSNLRSGHMIDYSSSSSARLNSCVEKSLFFSIEGQGDKLGKLCASSFTARDIEVAVTWATSHLSASHSWDTSSIEVYQSTEHKSTSRGSSGEIAVCLYDASHSKNAIRSYVDQCHALLQAKAYITSNNDDYLNPDGLEDICEQVLAYIDS